MEIFEELYEKYYNQLKHFALGLTRDINEAEEITQETFVRAITNIELLKILPLYKRKSWLFSTCKNCFIDIKRKLKFQITLEENFEEKYIEINYDSKIEAMKMLSKLPEKFRDIIFKKYWLDMTSQEIAQSLLIPDSTVRYHLRAAINFLRQKNINIMEGNQYDKKQV